MATFDRCAYYSTWPNPGVKHLGVTILDTSDVHNPRAAAYLDSPVTRDLGEALEVSLNAKLLIAGKFTSKPDAPLEMYDLSAGCQHPVLRSRSLPGLYLHVGEFTQDGQTFYGAKGNPDDNNVVAGIFALDTHNPSAPRLIASWTPPKREWVTHAVRVSPDGSRAYVALLRAPDDAEKSSRVNGMVILDISDIQARRPNPQFRLISTDFWDDTHYAQFALPVRVQGRQYVVFTDFMGAIGSRQPTQADVCASGKPPHGFARMIDVNDERHPKTVSKLMLEVRDPANCSKVMHDSVSVFGYGSSACDVDNPGNAKLLACGYWEAGLRVFDIRDPIHPRELAYYKPPARRKQARPGSVLRPATGEPVDYTADQVTVPKFRKNGQEIAFVSLDNGFQIVRFSDRFKAAYPEFFPRLKETKRNLTRERRYHQDRISPAKEKSFPWLKAYADSLFCGPRSQRSYSRAYTGV
jgi:hypothetical protein